MLPTRGWGYYKSLLKEVGENRFGGQSGELLFLSDLDLVDSDSKPILTKSGSAYFQAAFIKDCEAEAISILQSLIMKYAPATAILQALDGVATADRGKADSMLRMQGYGDNVIERSIGSLLTLMDHAELIRYSKNSGSIEVLVHPSHLEMPPPSIFISPKTPYGNRVWLRRVLEQCEGFIYWLDKHFQAVGLEPLWEAADGHRISDIRILSLELEQNGNSRALRDYRDLQHELKSRSIALSWNVIDSQKIRNTHDRWIIGSNVARNVPDVNTVFSGRYSELNSSARSSELKRIFEEYWRESRENGAVS